ncbi:MAG: PD40 domain-containing protein [Verrucomicrobiales bacterium]|nr:PD40 domain-containing protein [Verrucomicrobiales bacterium]
MRLSPCLPLRSLLCFLTVALGIPADAQLSPARQEPVIGARMPALSADGTRLAFVYRGDLWLASAEGGRAVALTQNIETDAYPLFSPDGRWVAFASKRTGNSDIFAVSVDGGSPRQLTWHGGVDLPCGWSPDGQRLLFSGKRDSANFGIFALDVQTLRTELLCEDYAALHSPSFAADGKRVVYGRYGFPWTRPRYHGSAAAQIWIMDLERQARYAVTQDGFQHLWTQFQPDGRRLVCVTVAEPTPSTSTLQQVLPKVVDSPRRTPNLWEFNLEGEGRPLTHFTGAPVRFPSVARRSGDIAFEQGLDVWRLRPGAKEPERITLYVSTDEKQSTRRREKLTGGVSEAEPSPDGKRFAFGLRGDLWAIPVEKPKGVAGRSAEFARRLTDWAGDDSDFVWTRDGKRLIFTSDREFNQRLYQLDLETKAISPLWLRDEDVTGPRLSPDGKTLGFWVSGKEGGLFLMSLDTLQARRLIKLPGPQVYGSGGGRFSWSPDQRWLAYEGRGDRLSQNIWVISVDGGEPINVTRLYAQHGDPVWSPDGKYLLFSSNRDGSGLYVLPLKWEEARTLDTDLKYEKPAGSVEVEIDFRDISRRIRKVTPQQPQDDLAMTTDGIIWFLSEGDIWSVGWDGRDARRATTGGGKSHFRIAAEGKKGFYTQNGDLYTLSLDSKSSEKVAFTADWERDVILERKAAFTQFWRSYHRAFYDGNFHGRDWEAIRKRYEPLLGAVETSDEFSQLLGMMVGELDASHAEVKSAAPAPSPITPHLGFTFDYSHPGPGLRIQRVPEGAPGWFSKTLLRPGEYVLAIDGREVRADERLYEWINDKQDREFEFTVSSTTSTNQARLVKYKVLTSEDWNELEYRNRVERRRKLVQTAGQDRIGYLHVSGMLSANQAKFEREIYEDMVGKDAMIIDVRFNTGGNISDTLIDWLERRVHGYMRLRDGRAEPSPALAWNKKLIVLMNEHSYSNAEMFPYALRARGLARLVGKATPGYVIWTWEFRLVDGTGARMPMTGFYRLDGTTQENSGEVPDVEVPLSPQDWLEDRDPQLLKAIELLTQ